MPHRDCVHLFCALCGRLSVLGFREAIGAVFDELLDTALRALDEGPVQRGEAVLVRRGDAGAPQEQDLDARRVALIRRPHEAGVAVRVGHVHRNIGVQQHDELEDVAIHRRVLEKVESLVVRRHRVRAVLEEEIDDVVVAAARRPEDGRRVHVAAFCVDVGAGLQ